MTRMSSAKDGGERVRMPKHPVKGMAMLISQCTDKSEQRNGIHTDFNELRRHFKNPSSSNDGFRQRLEVLAKRLASVQALGDEFRRVDLSEMAKKLLGSE